MAASQSASIDARRSPVSRTITLPELRSTVYLNEIPAWAAEELPRLYENCYSTVDYFPACDGKQHQSTCVLDDPRHIIVFTVEGRTAVVLNQLFDVDRDAATRIARSIFRALPHTKRLRFRGWRLDPRTLPLPTRICATASNMVIELPTTAELYLMKLGRETRHKLRNYPRKFRGAFPQHTFQTLGPDEIDTAFVESLIDLNQRRMASKGTKSAYAKTDVDWLLARARHFGFATAITIDDKLVAGTLGARVGRQCYLHIQGFDNEYAKYHLGMVLLFLTVSACIEEGVHTLHLLWGKSDYKTRLGSVEQRVWEGCVYRSHAWRLLSLDDAYRRQCWNWHSGPLSVRRADLRRRLGRVRRRLELRRPLLRRPTPRSFDYAAAKPYSSTSEAADERRQRG